MLELLKMYKPFIKRGTRRKNRHGRASAR